MIDIFVPPSTTNIPPVMLPAAFSNRLVKVDWQDDPSPSVLSYYQLWRSTTTNEVDFELIASPTVSEFTDTTVSNNVTYYYKAAAVSTGAVVTAFGNMVSATPFIPVPADLSATIGDEFVL